MCFLVFSDVSSHASSQSVANLSHMLAVGLSCRASYVLTIPVRCDCGSQSLCRPLLCVSSIQIWNHRFLQTCCRVTSQTCRITSLRLDRIPQTKFHPCLTTFQKFATALMAFKSCRRHMESSASDVVPRRPQLVHCMYVPQCWSLYPLPH